MYLRVACLPSVRHTLTDFLKNNDLSIHKHLLELLYIIDNLAQDKGSSFPNDSDNF